ncbi:hypothetical protein HHK36_025129 [Tetracentron sinense]|uniref:Uncharacterized protein n=1 Tax=Tetracentron sinense TaxID=13715 RepID=A0A835D7D9_TETSI|nr:hypothetical protein HHK36_025129 [Tetracentron sinense]
MTSWMEFCRFSSLVQILLVSFSPCFSPNEYIRLLVKDSVPFSHPDYKGQSWMEFSCRAQLSETLLNENNPLGSSNLAKVRNFNLFFRVQISVVFDDFHRVAFDIDLRGKAMPKMSIGCAVMEMIHLQQNLRQVELEMEEGKLMRFKWTFILSLTILGAAYYLRLRWSVLKSRKLVLNVLN